MNIVFLGKSVFGELCNSEYAIKYLKYRNLMQIQKLKCQKHSVKMPKIIFLAG